jgi:hypothetical protein
MSVHPTLSEMHFLLPSGRLDPTELAALVCSIPDLTPGEQNTVISECGVECGVCGVWSVVPGWGFDSNVLLF